MPYEHPWAIYDIRIRTERLELRLPTDDDLLEMLDRAQSGIHDPGEMPFGMAWTDQPSPWFERSFMQFHWGSRANWNPGNWSLDLGVWADGRLMGTQGMGADDFADSRTVSTGSWLAQEFQGRGYGKEMRSAVLGFAFETLSAQWATSGSFLDNPASAAVSRALGYDEDGFQMEAPRGEPKPLVKWRMSREQWYSRDRPWVDVSGMDRCWDLFGLA